MKEKLIGLLESIGFPVYIQGGLQPDQEYPESFFTFWDFQADENSHYNNAPASCDWGFWIYFYSVDPNKVESEPQKAKELLKEHGFSFVGKAVSAASDVKTHTGSMLTCYIKEVYKEDEHCERSV